MSDHDARELAVAPSEVAAKVICRDSTAKRPLSAEVLAESLPALFAFKQRIKSQLREVPHVEEDEPAVSAWYPSARQVLVWNLSNQPKTLTVVDGERRLPLNLGPLGTAPAEVAVRDDRPAH